MIPVASPQNTDGKTEFSASDCGITNSAFKAGEEVIYKIYYNWNFIWIGAGEVRFKVDDAGDEYHVVVQGRTYDSYDNFYRVRDRFETFLDKKTLMPNKFIRHVEEGSYRRYNQFLFDQDKGHVKSIQGHSADSNEVKDFQFDDCVHDVLSVLYYLRNLDIDKMDDGASIPVRVFLEEEYPLNVRLVEKNKSKRIKGIGKMNTHELRTELIAGEVFKAEDQMTAFVSTDRNRVPLIIESPLTVGKMKAVLVYQNGLRYPFTALED